MLFQSEITGTECRVLNEKISTAAHLCCSSLLASSCLQYFLYISQAERGLMLQSLYSAPPIGTHNGTIVGTTRLYLYALTHFERDFSK